MSATAVPAGITTVRPTRRQTLAREANAILAITWRELLRAAKSPLSLAFSIIFPVLFIGIMGGGINATLSGGLPYAYLPYMLIGMIASSMYQGTVAGVTNLVEERDHDLTAELFVAPIARTSVLVGKVIGAAIASMVALIGIFGMAVLMQIPLDAGDVLRVLAFTPILALAGGALGVLIVGITQDPKVVAAAIPLVVLPQLFLSGAIIPVGATDGILGVLARLIPMTYSVDLARNIFYAGKPEYALAVLNPMWLDAAVTIGFCLFFVVVGTWLFVRADRER